MRNLRGVLDIRYLLKLKMFIFGISGFSVHAEKWGLEHKKSYRSVSARLIHLLY